MLNIASKNPKFNSAVEQTAREMVSLNLGIKNFSIPNTNINLFLVRAESEEAKILDNDKGSLLPMVYEIDSEKFIISRKGVTPTA